MNAEPTEAEALFAKVTVLPYVEAIAVLEAALTKARSEGLHAAADELRDVALTGEKYGELAGWNPHRVWTWLRDRAEAGR